MQITIDITHEDILKARAQATGDSYIAVRHPSGIIVELDDKSDGILDSKYSVSEVYYTFKEEAGYSIWNREESVDFAFINIHLPEIWAYKEKEF